MAKITQHTPDDDPRSHFNVSDGASPLYIMDHIPGTNEGFPDGIFYSSNEPFTIDDVIEFEEFSS